jgi:hypothetical protein
MTGPKRIALFVIVLALGAPASASAASTAQRADRIMREITAQMTHAPSLTGVDHDKLSLAELLARYDRGEQLYIRCGNQVSVAQAILDRHGIRSRRVNTLSASGPWDLNGDGHEFMELRIGSKWIAYDPDLNRQAVDAHGRPIGAIRATYERPFHWRYIASDPYVEAGYPSERLNREVDHAMGIPAIQISRDPLLFAYRGTPRAKARVHSYPSQPLSWKAVGKRRWAKITRGEA